MVRRIADLSVREPYKLLIRFDDGKVVTYDVIDDVREIPSFEPLLSLPGLFESVMLDQSRTCVFWNDEIDLPSDAIYEFGEELLPALA